MEEYWNRNDAMEEQKDEEEEGGEEGEDTLEPKEEERRGAKRSAKDRLGTRRIKLDRLADLLSSPRVILSDPLQFKYKSGSNVYHSVDPDPYNAVTLTKIIFFGLLKWTASRDFLLQVFCVNHLPPSP
jgi:hypothetical protein